MELNESSNVSGSSENTTSTVSLVTPAPLIVKHIRREKDLSKPMFKEPFNYGWTREIVIRKNVGIKSRYDVYYYTPTNVKCRSSLEVQRFLDLNNTDFLTKNNFSFYPKLIGIDNPLQEVIRSAACVSADKNISIVGNKNNTKQNAAKPDTGKPKKKNSLKRKGMVKKSTLKTKISKNTSSTSVYKSGNVTEGKSDDSTVSTTESSTNAVVPIDTNDKTPNSEMKDPSDVPIISALEFLQTPSGEVEVTDVLSTLRLVFRDLSTNDSLTISEACKTLSTTVMQKAMCFRFYLHDWEKCLNFLIQKRSVVFKTMNMVMSNQNSSLDEFWFKFSDVIKKATNLITLKVYRCPVHTVADILESCPTFIIFQTHSIESPRFLKNTEMIQPLTECRSKRMKFLEVIKFKGINEKILRNFPSFSQFEFLRSFVLTNVNVFWSRIIDSLKTLPVELLQLEIGDCDHLPDTFNDILKRLVNLTSLRLVNCVGEHWKSNSNNIFTVIKHLKSLTMLELINIEISDGLKDNLGDCVQLRALLVILVLTTHVDIENYHLLECFNKLSRVLSYLAWGFVSQVSYKTKNVVYCYTLKNSKSVSETAQNEMESQRSPIKMLNRIPETKFTNMDFFMNSTIEDVLKTLYDKLKRSLTE